MVDSLIEIDKTLALAINGAHLPWLDNVMIIISDKKTWIPLYFAILLGFNKYFGWKASLLFTLAVILNLVATDQVSVLFKEGFLRLRPCHNLELNSLLHLPDGCGGKFSFVSSHASNTMGLAVLISFIFKNKYVSIGMLAFALLNGYSRIYLGKHFPIDIIGGFVLGVFCALFFYKLIQLVQSKFDLES